MIHIRIAEATDLPKMDNFGKVDPYCLIYYHSGVSPHQTEIIYNNYRPVWEHDISLTLNSLENNELCFKLMDHDALKYDDEISYVKINVSDFPFGMPIDKWYDMTPCKGVTKGGRLRIIIHKANLGERPFHPRQMQPKTRSYPMNQAQSGFQQLNNSSNLVQQGPSQYMQLLKIQVPVHQFAPEQGAKQIPIKIMYSPDQIIPNQAYMLFPVQLLQTQQNTQFQTQQNTQIQTQQNTQIQTQQNTQFQTQQNTQIQTQQNT